MSSKYVTTIYGSPGLFFDKFLDVKFTNDNGVTYIEISKIKPNLDKVELLFEKINLYCDSFSS